MNPQESFGAALLDPARPVPEGLGDGHGGPAGRRFAVYRNNVAVSLTEALESGFPTVLKLIGPTNFRGLAGAYLRAHPPRSPLMMLYGGEFPGFVAAEPQLRHLSYLPDVARLDLALRQAYHAADAVPVAPETLSSLPPGDLPDLRLRLAPAVRLVPSRWPIHGIHRFNHAPGSPKPQARPEDVLVTRPEFDPIPRLLPPGGAGFVAALLEGGTLAAALAAAGDGFDPAPVLALLAGDRCITAVEIRP